MQDAATNVRRGRPPTVTLDAILAAAVDLGFEHLSVAAVADRLGVTRTSIHRFVGSRDQLETMLGEHLITADPMPPDDGAPLPEYLLRFGQGIAERVRAHPGLGSYYARGFPRTDRSMRVVEDFVATLVARGLSARDALRLAGGVAACAIGLADYSAQHLAHEAAQPDADAGAIEAAIDPAAYPLVSSVERSDDDEKWWDWTLRAAVHGLIELTLNAPAGLKLK